MYNKIFDLINKEINFIYDSTSGNKLELMKIEIKGFKVKLVFLNRDTLTVKVRNYELDLFKIEPKLIFKKDYVKPFKDKYFR